MTHVLIVGMTESGKTSFGKSLAAEYKRKGTGVIVLDPMGDPEWQADVVTKDAALFSQTAERSQSCALFIDESGDEVGRYNDEMFWLATKARHFGHKSHFMTQRPAQLNKTVRDQCRHLAVFCISRDDAKLLSNDFGKEELLLANNLGQCEFFYTSRFGSIIKCRIDPVTKRVDQI